ncbi:MAG: amidohydrolase [Desulfarculaceae bacterium]|jgi:5-methylthioadenosine/S-adenosylhomocysteine deaminase
MPGDIIVKGGPLWAGPGKEWPQGLVAARQGKIIFAGPEEDYYADQKPPRVLDVEGGLILPGLVNAHCHGAMVLFRGLSDDLPLDKWLQDVIFPVEGRWVDEEMVKLCTLLAAGEMLLSGTTCVADSYFCALGAARAYEQAGMRAQVSQGIIDFPAPGVPDPAAKFEVCRDFVAACRQCGPLVSPGLFAHSLYTCSPQTLTDTASLTHELDVPWFTHLAETKEEVATVKERYGSTPVRHLKELGVLDSLQAGVHGIWTDAEEWEHLSESQVALIHCPESNLKLASGAGDPTSWLGAGLSVGLGTDGAASNNDLDLIGEMGMAARLAKVSRMDPAALPADQVLSMALAGSAAALGMADLVGRLEPGYAADLIVINVDTPHLTPLFDVPSALTYAARGSDVRHVVVAGDLVVQDRQVLTFDLKEVMAQVQGMAGQVQKGLSEV